MKYYYCDELNLIYLTINDADDMIDSIYLACTSNATINLTATESIRNTLMQRHTKECRDANDVKLILAIVDPNTTIVYYKLTLGLVNLNSLKNDQPERNKRHNESFESISQGDSAVE